MRKRWLRKGSSKTFRLDFQGALESRNGLTFLEIMLAMSILSMGILVLLAGFSEGMRARKSAFLYSKAIILTENLMDEKTCLSYSEEGITEGSWDEEPSFRWSIEITPFEIDDDENGQKTLSEIIITTRWQEGFRDKMFKLKTIIPAQP